jgi:hypothetical protein
MPRFVDRMKGASEEAGIRLPEPTLSLVAQYMGQDPPEGGGHDAAPGVEQEGSAETPEVEVEVEAVEPPDEQDPTELAADYGKVGEHVASMLESARAGAVKIRDEARREALRVTERSREDAAEVVADARSKASRLEAEAAELRAEAAEVLSRAQHKAGEQTRTAEGRRTALDKNVALAEERLAHLVGALRELANRLEDALERQASSETVDSAPSGGKALTEPLHEHAPRKAPSRQTSAKHAKRPESG